MKSMSLKTILVTLPFVIFGLSLMSGIAPQKPWDVPAKFKTMKNPKANDASALAMGKELWNKNCSSCHGKTGLGENQLQLAHGGQRLPDRIGVAAQATGDFEQDAAHFARFFIR